MPSQKPTSARTIATTVLNQTDPKHSYAAPALNNLLQSNPLPTERQRATDLVFGTIRNRSAVDMIIAKLADCPVRRIPAKMLNIIRIGVYELTYTPQTAEYAIVDEAVENTRAVAGKKQTAFVNAVLRQITRHIQNRQIPLSKADAAKTLPQTLTSGCRFDVDLLPDPKESPQDYLVTAFSLPKWLVSNWLSEFGYEKTMQICFASNRRPSTYVRPNILKITIDKAAEKLRQAGIDLEIANESMIKINGSQMVTELPGFAQGLFSIQDITASQPARILEPQPDWAILDLCAAPGTKTTQLAELTGDKAKIIATDIDSERLEKVRENIIRLGINSVRTILYDNLKNTAAKIGPFDCILLDAPCSNTGVLARRAEARYRLKPTTPQTLAKKQYELLKTAAAIIKPHGRICYSTCSIEKCENSELIKRFLTENDWLKLKSEKLTLPSAQGLDRDGGYTAIITAGFRV